MDGGYHLSVLLFLHALLVGRLVAVVAPSSGREDAIIEVVLYENNRVQGGYTTFNHKVDGRFTAVGQATGAEGDISQVPTRFACEPLSKVFDTYGKNYGWVAFIKLPAEAKEPVKPCVSLASKAEEAIQRGATAVIFDVSHQPLRVAELEVKDRSLYRPVLVVSGVDAVRMSELLTWDGFLARARIHRKFNNYKVKTTSNEYFDMGIFMAFFILVSLVCIGMLLKIKYRQRKKQMSLTRMALQAIARMETRKFTRSQRASRCSSRQTYDAVYSCTRWPSFDIHSCAICLEAFTEGQDIRIVPCRHEFHKSCVDPWLISNCTCPLCMLSIVEPFIPNKKASSHPSRWSRFQARLRLLLPSRFQSRPRPPFSSPVVAAGDSLLFGDVMDSTAGSIPSLETIDPEAHCNGMNAATAEAIQPADLSRQHNSHRLHFCRNHRKKHCNDVAAVTSVGQSQVHVNATPAIDHTIVVVANFPDDDDKPDDLQEDVV